MPGHRRGVASITVPPEQAGQSLSVQKRKNVQLCELVPFLIHILINIDVTIVAVMQLIECFLKLFIFENKSNCESVYLLLEMAFLSSQLSRVYSWKSERGGGKFDCVIYPSIFIYWRDIGLWENVCFQCIIFQYPHHSYSRRIKPGLFYIRRKKLPSAISFPESKERGGVGSKILTWSKLLALKVSLPM